MQFWAIFCLGYLSTGSQYCIFIFWGTWLQKRLWTPAWQHYNWLWFPVKLADIAKVKYVVICPRMSSFDCFLIAVLLPANLMTISCFSSQYHVTIWCSNPFSRTVHKWRHIGRVGCQQFCDDSKYVKLLWRVTSMTTLTSFIYLNGCFEKWNIIISGW